MSARIDSSPACAYEVRMPPAARHGSTLVISQDPLLRPLLTLGAGLLSPPDPGPVPPAVPGAVTFIYCLKGCGWCKIGSRLHTLNAGHLIVLSSGADWTCGTRLDRLWTGYWAHATGVLLPEYLRRLQPTPQDPLIRLGEDPHLARLFSEVVRACNAGLDFIHSLQAATGLASLLAHVIAARHQADPVHAETPHKVAQSIIYMGEHLHESLRVSTLARLAGLSAAHFSVLFREHTGCSPRDYLHLLRIHKACELLTSSGLPIKEIAARLGYPDPLHFSRRFKSFQGQSPTDYRASNLKFIHSNPR